MNQEDLKRQVTKQSLEYTRAVVRVLFDEIENGLEVSERLYNEVEELYCMAFHVVHDPYLKQIFKAEDLT